MQIKLQVPLELATSFDAFAAAQAVVTTSHGSSLATAVPIYPESPGAFTIDGSGCGQALALNVAPDGTLSANSHENSAAPGDYVAIYGTGFSAYFGGAPDGVAPAAASSTLNGSVDQVILDGGMPLNASYSGVVPGLVGVHQLNFQIPPGTPNRCDLPVTIAGERLSGPTVTISINSARGTCSDPDIKSYGSISLTKTITTSTAAGTSSEADQFTAKFPSGPGLTPPPSVTTSLPYSTVALI